MDTACPLPGCRTRPCSRLCCCPRCAPRVARPLCGAQAVLDLLADGTVRPPPPRKVYPLAEARAAVHDACREVPGGTGKVMLSN